MTQNFKQLPFYNQSNHVHNFSSCNNMICHPFKYRWRLSFALNSKIEGISFILNGLNRLTHSICKKKSVCLSVTVYSHSVWLSQQPIRVYQEHFEQDTAAHHHHSSRVPPSPLPTPWRWQHRVLAEGNGGAIFPTPGIGPAGGGGGGRIWDRGCRNMGQRKWGCTCHSGEGNGPIPASPLSFLMGNMLI